MITVKARNACRRLADVLLRWRYGIYEVPDCKPNQDSTEEGRRCAMCEIAKLCKVGTSHKRIKKGDNAENVRIDLWRSSELRYWKLMKASFGLLSSCFGFSMSARLLLHQNLCSACFLVSRRSDDLSCRLSNLKGFGQTVTMGRQQRDLGSEQLVVLDTLTPGVPLVWSCLRAPNSSFDSMLDRSSAWESLRIFAIFQPCYVLLV